jgi:tRNA nucleotidyltransferase (CCA-adding enzyme)
MADARLVQRLYRRMPGELAAAVRCAVAVAVRRGEPLYLVGGGVRDLLVSAAHLDIDLVVEGDAIALAGAVAKAMDARVVRHPSFGTAVVRGEGFRLDFAGARSERYQRPGALPTVEPASLLDDLARRDFTINALALGLDGPRGGALIDPFGGREDIVRRRIRVLHDGSFRDDATRVVRAVRYAGRLGFRLEARTARLLRVDLSYADTISGARLRRELERIADEDRVGVIVRLAARLGVLRALHPALAPDDRALRAFGRVARIAPPQRSAVLFALLLARATPSRAEAAIARLMLTRAQSEAVRGVIALRRQAARLGRVALRPSAAAAVLDGSPPASIEAFALVTEHKLAGERARRYLNRWRQMKTFLNGNDVVALGVRRGPRVGEALSCLRDARVDGEVKTRKDEEALVRKKFVERPSRARRRRG